jgi:hypothetical protein
MVQVSIISKSRIFRCEDAEKMVAVQGLDRLSLSDRAIGLCGAARG